MINRIFFANRCPSEDDWQALLSDDLPATRQSEMESHLDQCRHCLGVVESLTPHMPDSLLGESRAYDPMKLGENEYWRSWAILRTDPQTTVAESDGSSSLPGALLPFERSGEYESRGEIGSGGMGVVYRAWQREVSREVAIKMLRGQTRRSAGGVARLKGETQRLANLEHPNIVRLYAAAEHSGVPYFTMQLVDGRTLARVARDGPVRPKRAAELVTTIARAVQYAHERKVIHLDLKPGNILLTAADVPMITDFGLAKTLDEVTSGPRCEVAGTAEYMAPEQWLGDPEHLCERTDVYGIGTILYELLVARPPFLPSQSRYETRRRVLTGRLTPPRQIGKRIPKDLEAICLRCLQRSPEDRYGSAREVAEDLDRFLWGYPPEPCSGFKRVCYLARRNRAFTAVACAGLLVAAVSFTFLASYRMQSQVGLAKVDFAEGLEDARKGKITEGVSLMRRAIAILPPGEAILGRHYRQNVAAWEAWRPRRIANHDHGAVVTAAAASADGRHVLLGDAEGAITLWDRIDGSVRVLPMDRRSDRIRAVAFDKTSTYCASAIDGSRVTVWDVRSAERVSECSLDGRGLYSLAFLGKGGRFVTGSADKAAPLRLWDARTGIEAAPPPKAADMGIPTHLISSPEGDAFVSISTRGECCLWDVRTGERIADISRQLGYPVSSAAFSPDGATLAAAGEKELALCDGSRGGVRRRLPLVGGRAIKSIAYRRDGGLTLVLDAGERTFIRCATSEMDAWDDVPIDQMTGSVFMDPSAGQDFVISGVQTTSIELLRLPRFENRVVELGVDAGASSVVVSGDSSRILTLMRRKVPTNWRPRTSEEFEQLRQSWVRIWDYRTLRPLSLVTELPPGIVARAMDLSPSGDTLALGCESSKTYGGRVPVLLGSLSADNTIAFKTLGMADSDVRAIAFTRDGKSLVTGSVKLAGPAELIYWNLDGRDGWKVPYPVSVNAIAVSPESNWIAVGGEDGILRLIPMARPTSVAFAFQTGGGITAVAFSNHGDYVAAANAAGRILAFDMSGAEPRRVADLPHPGEFISAIAFGHADDVLYAGTLKGDRGVYCYDTLAWKLIGPVIGMNGGITDLSVSARLPAIIATTTNGHLVKRAISAME